MADWFLSSETKALIVKAVEGDRDAQFLVGAAYDTGNGAPHNEDEAMNYYRMAADSGHPRAQNSVGSILQAEKQYSEALPWYERAAEQGDAQATNNLGYLYDLGLGVQKDVPKGFGLYMKAAELGWAESMWNIANMYGAGQLGSEDLVMACIWTYRSGKFAAPHEGRLRVQAQRTLAKVEALLSVDQRSSCWQQGDQWSPQAKQSKSDVQPDAK